MTHRILIVDDDLEFNALIGDVFAQANYSVETTSNAESALGLLREETISNLPPDMEDLQAIENATSIEEAIGKSADSE